MTQKTIDKAQFGIEKAGHITLGFSDKTQFNVPMNEVNNTLVGQVLVKQKEISEKATGGTDEDFKFLADTMKKLEALKV